MAPSQIQAFLQDRNDVLGLTMKTPAYNPSDMNIIRDQQMNQSSSIKFGMSIQGSSEEISPLVKTKTSSFLRSKEDHQQLQEIADVAQESSLSKSYVISTPREAEGEGQIR